MEKEENYLKDLFISTNFVTVLLYKVQSLQNNYCEILVICYEQLLQFKKDYMSSAQYKIFPL